MSDSAKPVATLGGKFLLASSPVQWNLAEGIRPVMETFDMTPSDALSIDTTNPVELVIDTGQGNRLSVKNLSVLNISPGDNPFISKVTVADRRWRWSYRHIVRRFNMRRHIGPKRIIANDQISVPFATAPLVAYWDWSKNKGSPWTARAALENVLGDLQDFERNEAGILPFSFKIDEKIGSKLRSLPLEDMTLDDSADQALDRMLSYFPEARLYIDYDGNVVIYSKASGGESEIVRALLPEMQDRGHVDLVKNNLVRPREIHVLFTREVELRFDFVEDDAATRTGDERLMENVAPVSDYQLTIAGNTVPLGTWAEMTSLFTAWGNLPVFNTPITHAMVQRAFIPQMDLWSALQIAGDFPDQQGSLKNWVGRIAAIQNHYRRTFRLYRKWMDRVFSIRAYRLSTIDPQSGQRGPATAHGDYCIIPSQRSYWRRTGKPLVYAINKSAYPTGSGTFPPLDNTAETSPAIVSILDHDQGIVHVDYSIDPNRVFEMILPSQMVGSSIPTADLTARDRSVSFDSVRRSLMDNPPRLSPSFKLALMITAVPASPNTTQQLHKIIVKPQDVAGLLPDVGAADLGNCDGPPMEIRIGADVEVARVQWLDAKSGEIEKIFGIGSGEPDLTGLVLNDTADTSLVSGASLRRIALAKASMIYASLVNRYEGSMTGALNGKIGMRGWVDSIVHRLDPNGEATTGVAMSGDVPQLDLFGFLDSNTRAAILRLVQPL